MKILNLYAGIGGNRCLWGSDHDITAVENNREIALEYKKNFPNDNVIITDAHHFLIDNFQDFEFIWSSPPCPSHSRMNRSLKGYNIFRFPDLKLYEEILFLTHFFTGKFVVENVIPYYTPLVTPSVILDRHMFWVNFGVPNIGLPPKGYDVSKATKETLSNSLGINIPKAKDARKLLRNCVNPMIGKHLLDCSQ